jgi:hypothetical protein
MAQDRIRAGYAERLIPFARVCFFVVLFLSGNAGAAYQWTTGVIHEPRYFAIGQQSLLIDGSGDTHAFYGGNHLYHARHHSGQWLVEVVDNAPRTGANATAAIDSGGKFHVIYFDGWKNETRYATNVSGSWATEKFSDPLPGLIPQPLLGSIAVDASGRIHFVYYEGQKIMYARRGQSGWQKSEIDYRPGPTLSSPTQISIALDSAGHCHVSYWFSTSNSESFLKYSTNSSGVWSSEIVDPRASAGLFGYQNNSIALDATGRPHIAYQGPDQLVYFASRGVSGWTVQLVDNSSLGGVANAGLFTSIDFDGNGNVWIAHLASSSSPAGQIVRLSTNVTGPWTTTSIATLDYYSKGTSLQVDPTGAVQILYHSNANGGIYRATRTPSGTSVDLVDREEVTTGPGDLRQHPGSVGLASSLFVDTDGFMHVTYLSEYGDLVNSPSQPRGRLLYATNKGGTWRNEPVTGHFGDGSPYQFIEHAAVSVDHQGIAHVAFRDSSQVVYGNNRSGMWTFEQLDLAYSFGPEPLTVSIALDSDGFAHVAYFAADPISQPQSARLRYATNRSGVWAVQTVTSIVALPGFGLQSDLSVALTVADDNKIHLAFLGGNSDVIYATNSSGVWAVTTIGEADPVFIWVQPSLVVQPDGVVHMAFISLEYIDGTGYYLGVEYASNASGTWEREFVDDQVVLTDTSYSGMRRPSLAVAADGTPHVTYEYFEYASQGGTLLDGRLRYARRPGNLWRISDLETTLRVGEDSRVSLLSSSLPIVVYADMANGSLKSATAVFIPGPEIDVTFEPDDLDFSVAQSSGVTRRLFTLFNRGSESLIVSAIRVQNVSGTGNFTLDFNAGTVPCGRMPPIELMQGNQCNFELSYGTSSVEETEALFSIESNDPEMALIGAQITGYDAGAPATDQVAAKKGGGCTLSPEASDQPVLLAIFLLWIVAGLWHRSRRQTHWSASVE